MKTWMMALCAAVALSACSSTGSSSNEALRQIAVKENKIVAHFALDGKESPQKVANGYYRKWLGSTAAGDFVVQDFYSRNDQKQSDALKIAKEGNIRAFDNAHTSGEVTLYYANGARMENSVYEKGQLVGNSTAYYPNGTIFSVNQFENGQLNGRSQYFYQDGKLAANFEYVSGRLVNVEAWDQQQQVVTAAKMPELIQALQNIDGQNQQEALRLAQ